MEILRTHLGREPRKRKKLKERADSVWFMGT